MSTINKTLNIDINHVTRVEGHGSIRVNVKEGVVEQVELCITEAHRFFETFTRDMLPHEIPWVVGRICGICCVGHQLAATKAVENALRLQVSPQTLLLRKLLNLSQFLQSHVLHVYFLAVPDFLGVPSVLPLAQSQPELVRQALRLKKLANDFTAVFGGRALHPMSPTLRGWRKLPERAAMEDIERRLRAALPDFQELICTLRTLKVPVYERETEYVSLRHPDEYALYDGDIYSSDTGTCVPVREYRAVTNEFTRPQSTTKWSRWHRQSYAVGALARFNNNHLQLHDEARQAAQDLGLRAPCYNPYQNTIAQAVELVHCAHESLELLEQVLTQGLREESIDYQPGPGRGVGATEVPRGILFHEYAFNEQGRCDDANAIIPTSQNINNIEQDMKAFVPAMLPGMNQQQLALHMEMLLRAYDPCISCSVHMLNVEFVD